MLLTVREQIEIFPSDRLTKALQPITNHVERQKIQFMLSHNNTNHRQETLADMWAQEEALKALSHRWISARQPLLHSTPAGFVLYLSRSLSLSVPLSLFFFSFRDPMPFCSSSFCAWVLTSLTPLQPPLLSLLLRSAIHYTYGGLAPTERAAWTSSCVLRSLYLRLSPAISLSRFLLFFYSLAHTLARSSVL